MGCEFNGFDFLVIGCNGDPDPEVSVVATGICCFSKSGVDRIPLVGESGYGMGCIER